MRCIRPGDETAFAATAGPIASRRASGAARIVARSLLEDWRFTGPALLDRSVIGAPIWPIGFLGSLAHDHERAVAAVARAGACRGLGIDVEPAAPLPADLHHYVLSRAERTACAGDAVAMRAVFVVKEAVYKAINPLDGSGLEYGDIAFEADASVARVRDGRSLAVYAHRGRALIAVAVLD